MSKRISDRFWKAWALALLLVLLYLANGINRVTMPVLSSAAAMGEERPSERLVTFSQDGSNLTLWQFKLGSLMRPESPPELLWVKTYEAR